MLATSAKVLHGAGEIPTIRGTPLAASAAYPDVMSVHNAAERDHPSRRGPLRFLAEALRAGERDFSRGPIRPALALLAIPMVLEMSMEAIFAIVDVFWIAHLGANAIAVVGLTEAMLALVYSIAIGVGMAVTAIVARRIGEQQPERAAVTAGQAIWLSAICGLGVAVIGAYGSDRLLEFMGATQAMITDSGGYTYWMLVGSASIFYLFILNAIFRGAGDAAIAMRSLVLANGINLILDPCLIFGWWLFPELGVEGAAIATTIGRSVGVVYQLVHLTVLRTRIAVPARALAPNIAAMGRLLRVSAGGVGQFLIATSSWVFMLRMVASFGAATTAGFTVAIRVVEFIFLPAWGLGNAAATLVGQSLGAGLVARAREAAWTAAWVNVVGMTLLGVAFLAIPEIIVSIFTADVDVAAFAATTLRWFGIGLPLYAIGMILVQAINGAGDTRTPTLLNLVFFWILQIPLGWTLAYHSSLAVNGVLVAIVVAESLLSAAAVLVFRRGRWQNHAV